ncbi:MAG: hypothetical protein VW600_18295 [Ferrovibrio sp.]
MDAEQALILVVPAMLVLLAAGGLAGYIETAVYLLHGNSAGTGDSVRLAQLNSDYSRRRSELATLREEKSQLDDSVAAAIKERANLQDQERRLADRSSNLVAEAGYPAPGTQGFYFHIEGPAQMMPFCSLASVPTALGGKRRVRLVVWAGSMEAAQAVAVNWAGDGAKMLDVREFNGKLFWHEA